MNTPDISYWKYRHFWQELDFVNVKFGIAFYSSCLHNLNSKPADKLRWEGVSK